MRRQLREARAYADGGEAGEFDWVKPHTFRKTVATLIEREIGIEEAAAQLGHSASAITRKHYVERAAQAPDVRAALNLLAPVRSISGE